VGAAVVDAAAVPVDEDVDTEGQDESQDEE
jgi:hypothetical protein